MGKLGGGITLLVIGAILTFAVDVRIPGIGKDALGLILMAGGLLAILLWFATDQRRHSHTVVDDRVGVVDDVVEPAPVRRRRRYL